MTWLAEKTGIPDSTLGPYIENGIATSEKAVKIAEALGVSIDWLLTGSETYARVRGEEVLASLSQGRAAQSAGQASSVEQLGLTMIPEVDIAYSMGGGLVLDEHIEQRMVPFRRDWLSRLTRDGPADVFLTRGQGDSMMPTLLDDDDVLVNRADRAIRQQDRIWALGYGDLGMIKRVRRLPSGLFQLNSDNPAVTPIEATEDELYIVGRVIWIGRRV
jgi:phage repressor protein C with HTH and peptisase S24 domain